MVTKRKSSLVESFSLTGGILTRVISEVADDENAVPVMGDSLDVAFAVPMGQSRLLSDVLADLEKRCLQERVYIEMNIVVKVRDGLTVVESDQPWIEALTVTRASQSELRAAV